MAAALAGHGRLHAPPIPLEQPSTFAAVLGTPACAAVVWTVKLGSPPAAAPLQLLPVGVRVVDHLVEGKTLYLVVESVAVLGQPAGLRAVIPVVLAPGLADVIWYPGSALPRATTSQILSLAGVANAGDLAARLAAPPPPAVDGPAFATAAAAAPGVASMAAPSGVDVYTEWQSTFLEKTGHLDPAAFAALADRTGLSQQNFESCDGPVCGTSSPRLVVGKADGRRIVTALLADPPPTFTPIAPAAVAETGAARAAATAALGELYESDPPAVDAAAPFDAEGGAIGVYEDGGSTVAVMTDGGWIDLSHLSSYDASAGASPDASVDASAASAPAGADVRFADFDGDGRTDVLFLSPAPTKGALAFRSPRLPGDGLGEDQPAEHAAHGKPTLAAALAAVLAVPSRGLDSKAACSLLLTARSPAGFARVALPGARVWQMSNAGELFDELLGSHAGSDPELGQGCPQLDCDPMRPICTNQGGFTGMEYEIYFFTFVDGAPRLADAMFYNGP